MDIKRDSLIIENLKLITPIARVFHRHLSSQDKVRFPLADLCSEATIDVIRCVDAGCTDKPYVQAAVRNRLIKITRRKPEPKLISLSTPINEDESSTLEDILPGDLEYFSLNQLSGNLSEQERMLLHMRLEGHGFKTIARKIGCSVSKTRQMYSSLKESLDTRAKKLIR